MRTTPDEIVGDDEAAKLFGLSRSALRQHCMKSHVCRPGTVDVRLALPVVVGRKRRWTVSRIVDLLTTPMPQA